jgi:fructose-bisphosphate aldolase class II
MTGQVRKVLAEKKSDFDPRAYLKPAMAALRDLCAQRYQQFGSAGQAPKIKPVALADMAKRYKAGALAL